MSASSEAEAPAGPSEHTFVEVAAAVLLGLAAVAIAFTGYQSALWGGVKDTANTESVLATNESVDLLQNADTLLTSDQALFIEILSSEDCAEVDELSEVEPLSICGQIFGALSDEGSDAVLVWEDSEDLYPFRTEAYLAIYDAGNAAADTSQVLLDDGKRANKNGDNYELAATFLTTVLFFAGISLVVRHLMLRTVLLLGASAVLVGASIYMLTLPRTF